MEGKDGRAGIYLGVGHEYHAFVAPCSADVCEPDARVPRGPLYDGAAGFESVISVVRKDGKGRCGATDSPWSSASRTTPSAARSLTLPPGF